MYPPWKQRLIIERYDRQIQNKRAAALIVRSVYLGQRRSTPRGHGRINEESSAATSWQPSRFESTVTRHLTARVSVEKCKCYQISYS